MIAHLCKMVWNRKRTNFLIGVELFLSFLVLCAVLTVCIYFADNYRRPLGFTYDDVWHIDIDKHGPVSIEAENELKRQIVLAVKGFDEVEATAYVTQVPFKGAQRGAAMYADNGQRILNKGCVATDDLHKVLGLEIVEGRWFDRGDEGLRGVPVVINRSLAEIAFGQDSPVGKEIERFTLEDMEKRSGDDVSKVALFTVVGVIDDFRGDDFAPPAPFAFRRASGRFVPWDLLVKLKPGTKAVFGERLLARLQSTAKEWIFSIKPLSEHRESNAKLYLTFLVIGGVVAVLLIAMVSLGMVGVLWQNVTQRIGEIGLRRALGGATRYIAAQFVGELLVVTTAAVVLATALIVQLPLSDAIEFVRREVYLGGLCAAAALIYLLVVLCALYPSWLASRVQPAEALHYE